MEQDRLPVSNRIEYLDSMRGIAATSVLWSHFVHGYQLPSPWDQVITHSPLAILWDGFAAVSFFFVLSGFVLSLKYFKYHESPNVRRDSFIEYFIARVGRIWAPYCFVVMVSLFLKRFLFFQVETIPQQTEWIQSFWKNQTLLKHLVLETNLFVQPNLFTLLPQAWSLYVEMTLSLFIPIAVVLAVNHFYHLLAVSVLLVLSLNAPVYVFHFGFGLILAKYFRAHSSKWKSLKVKWKSLILLIGIVLYGFMNTVEIYLPLRIHDSISTFAKGLGSVSILFAVLSSSRLQKILSHSFFRHLGKVSYSIYLCHFAILLVWAPQVIRGMNAIGITHVGIAWCAGFVLTTLATWLVSTVLYHICEVPCIAQAKKISKSIVKLR